MKNKILTLLLIIFCFAGYAQENGKNFIDQNYIEVTGYSEKYVSPNRIYLKILINEKDFKGQNIAQIEESMFTKLKEIGIDVSANVVIKDFVSNFVNYWVIKSDILLIKEYEVLVYDASTAGKVYSELEKIGISNITIDRLDHSEIEKFREENKIASIKSAKEKAKTLASSIDQEIGRALYINEHVNNLNMFGALQGKVNGIQIRGMSSKTYGSKSSIPAVEFEKIKLEYSVTVRFELK